MLLGNLDAAGRLLTSVVAPSATDSFNGGIASAPNGALRTITGTPPQFVNSFGVSATGQLYTQAGGTIDHFTGGLPFTANGSLVVQENLTPSANDPFVGGIRVGPLGGVYTVTDAAPVNSIPVNTTLPAITGSNTVGSVLTATTGVWTGYPAPTFAYQWKRGATNVGTNANTYTTVAGDAGLVITCVVTATNSSGSVQATSNGITIASGENPIITTAKAILATYGANAHVWLAGVGTVGGYPANNYIDNGVTLAAVGDAVQLVDDTTSTADMSQATVGRRPPLRDGGGGKYYWEFDGATNSRNFITQSKVINSVTALTTIIGCQYNLTSQQNVFGQSISSASSSVIDMGSDFSNQARLSLRGDNNIGTFPVSQAIVTSTPFIMTGRASPTTLDIYYNVAKVSVTSTCSDPLSGARSYIGCRIQSGQADTIVSIVLTGRIYGVIAINATVPDADLRSLQDYMALLTGVTL